MTMKKVLMVLVAAMLMMGVAGGAQAFIQGENYTLTNSPVKFYLVDWDTTQFNGQIIMNATTLGAPIEGLKYSFDNSSWLSFTPGPTKGSGTATITALAPNRTQLMYLAYGGDSTGDMTFINWNDSSRTNTIPQYLDLFTSLMIDFGGSDYREITITSNTNNDKFAPVPIPPAVYLLGAGLLGLVGLRKRFNK
jgi:ABC-type proline/glycine betaine transport system substrate-binding protein